MKTLALLTLAACLTFLPGCDYNSYDRITGSNVLLTEAHDTPTFHSVVAKGSLDVTIDTGPEVFVEVSGDDNILPYVEVEVKNEILHVGMEPGSYSYRQPLTVNLVMPEVREVDLYGSGDVTINDVNGEELALGVSGSGDVSATGNVNTLEVTISGSGDFRLYELVAAHARVRVAGSGDVRLHATETLDAKISGSGDIRYKGQPRTTIRTAGSGSVQSAD